MSIEPHPYPSGFLAALSGLLAYVGVHIYGVVVAPPSWLEAVVVPLLAASLAATGPVAVQWMRQRYDGRLRAEIMANDRLREDNDALRDRLRRTPEKDGMGL